MRLKFSLTILLFACLPAAPAAANGKLCLRAIERYGEAKDILLRCLPFAVEGDVLAQAVMSLFHYDYELRQGASNPREAKKWFDRAAAALRKRSAAGDGEAAYQLAQLFWKKSASRESKDGDVQTATKWFREAARRDHPLGQMSLGALLLGALPNKPKPAQIAEIRSLLEASARAGVTNASYYLGQFLEYGLAGKSEPSEIVRLYQKAANAGSGQAQSELSGRYKNGRGVPKDPYRAYLWAKAAANYPGELWANNDVVDELAKALTPAQIANAHREIKALHARLLADMRKRQRPPPAEGTTAACRAAFVAGDGRRAVRECSLAARKGDSEAAYRVAISERGRYLDVNTERGSAAGALKWFRLGADRGDVRSMNAVGMMSLNGEGAARDYAEAFWWLWQAARRGFVQAQYNLGAMYLNEKALPPSIDSAYVWLKLAEAKKLRRAEEALRRIGLAIPSQTEKDAASVIAAWKPMDVDTLAGTAPKNAASLCKAALEPGKNATAATPHCIAAAWRGDARSQYTLGHQYRYGRTLPRSWPLAYAWMKIAAENGSQEARKWLQGFPDLGLVDSPVDAAHIATANKLAQKMKAEIARRAAKRK